jgi:hypothetical protein
MMKLCLQVLLRHRSGAERWPDAFGNQMELLALKSFPLLKELSVPIGYQKSVVFAPFISALIVTDKLSLSDLFGGEGKASDYFQFKQIIEFDRQWYESALLATVGLMVKKGSK